MGPPFHVEKQIEHMKIHLHYKRRLEVHIKAQLRLYLWYKSQSMGPIAVGNEALERAIEHWKAEIKKDYESHRSHAPPEQIGRAHV